MGLRALNRLSGWLLQTQGRVPVQHGSRGEDHDAVAQRRDVNWVARERVQPQLHMKHTLLVCLLCSTKMCQWRHACLIEGCKSTGRVHCTSRQLPASVGWGHHLATVRQAKGDHNHVLPRRHRPRASAGSGSRWRSRGGRPPPRRCRSALGSSRRRLHACGSYIEPHRLLMKGVQMGGRCTAKQQPPPVSRS